MPIAAKGKKPLSSPIFGGPSIATGGTRGQAFPSLTLAPVPQEGPNLHEAGTFALGSMMAVGWMFIRETQIELRSTDSRGRLSLHNSCCYPLADPFPRELSINWHDTPASATRLSPT